MQVRTIQDMRALVRGRRADLGLSQAEVAMKAGVSRRWLSTFEAGHETAELGKVFALLEALDVHLLAVNGLAGEDAPVAATEAATDIAAVDLRQTLSDYYWGSL